MWFTETPWPPFLVCLLVAAVFFGRWSLTGRRAFLAASAFFLLIAGAVVAVEKLIVTQAERVEANIYGLAKAFEAGDVGRCSEYFSAQDPADRELVQRAAGQIKIDGPIRISDLSIAMSSAESRAVAVFRASADASFQGYHDRARTRWELTWQREGGDWKIIHLRRLNLLGDGEIKQPFTAAE